MFASTRWIPRCPRVDSRKLPTSFILQRCSGASAGWGRRRGYCSDGRADRVEREWTKPHFRGVSTSTDEHSPCQGERFAVRILSSAPSVTDGFPTIQEQRLLGYLIRFTPAVGAGSGKAAVSSVIVHVDIAIRPSNRAIARSLISGSDVGKRPLGGAAGSLRQWGRQSEHR